MTFFEGYIPRKKIQQNISLEYIFFAIFLHLVPFWVIGLWNKCGQIRPRPWGLGLKIYSYYRTHIYYCFLKFWAYNFLAQLFNNYLNSFEISIQFFAFQNTTEFISNFWGSFLHLFQTLNLNASAMVQKRKTSFINISQI